MGVVGELAKLAFLGVVLAVMSNALVKFMLYLDLNKRAYNHVPGQCNSVAGIEFGAPDMALLPSGLVLVTSGLKFYANVSEIEKAKGAVYVYNATGKTAWELKIESKTLGKKNFFPHGIGIFEDQGRITVFVVNHRAKADTVEVFRYKEKESEKSLAHLRTVKSPFFVNLHDVVPVSKDKFYVSNYHYFKHTHLQSAELYLNLRLGNVVFFDGKNATTPVRYVATPSGLTLDKGKKNRLNSRFLYVSSITEEKIFVYKIEKDHNLTLFSDIALYTSPNNVFVDPYTADLFVAAHPVKSRLFRHESQPKTIYSPSQVLRLHGRPSKGNWTMKEVYMNDGATLSASSSAIKLKTHLLIGSLHDKLLSCEIDSPVLV